MNKTELKRYTNLSCEIDLLKSQLEKLEPEYVEDTVNGSSIEFPYTQHKVHIEGYDLEDYKRKAARLNKKIIKKLNELIEEKEKLIEFIYTIEDTEVRQIFIYKYIDKLFWYQIAIKMNYGESTIRYKFNKFMKNLED